MSDLYDKLPYGEVQRDMSVVAFERLEALVRNSSIELCGNEAAVETVTSVEVAPGSRELILDTELTVFVPVFSNIGQVLVEHDRLPDYLLDTLSHLAGVIEERRVSAVSSSKQMCMKLDTIKALAHEHWHAAEPERLTGQPFNVITVYIPEIGAVDVHMEYSTEHERWKLGYRFTEPRKYEYHGGYAYRIIDGNLFTDPTGTEGDMTNVSDGMYLPSRLDLNLFKKPSVAY